MSAGIAFVLLATGIAALAGTVVWNGASQQNNNFGNGENWVGDSPPDSGDKAVIDHTTPRDTVKINANDRYVFELFVGDGHEIDLANNLYVTGENGGGAEFEGTVTLSNTSRIYADFVVVNSDTENTVIQYDGTGSNEHIVLGT